VASGTASSAPRAAAANVDASRTNQPMIAIPGRAATTGSAEKTAEARP
jgi:hypothetical protein